MFGDPVANSRNWAVKSLLNLGDFKNGLNFHKEEVGINLRCLGVGDFKNFSVINDVRKLPLVSLNEKPSLEYLLRDGDIVFVRSNGNKELVGRCLVVYTCGVPTTFSGFCIRYRLNNNTLNIMYLLHVLKSESVRSKMMGRGANIQNLNQQILAAINVPIPPIDLQNQFADFVAQVDKSKFWQ
ncbi:restriction endonuclease subunit S [Phascolarctobacterium sp.]|uniref:restriction endonuclease subunit S n=1 Tax=Phascolarctobacterium sp. TaxID=2049039 RepID=UPI00386D862E